MLINKEINANKSEPNFLCHPHNLINDNLSKDKDKIDFNQKIYVNTDLNDINELMINKNQVNTKNDYINKYCFSNDECTCEKCTCKNNKYNLVFDNKMFNDYFDQDFNNFVLDDNNIINNLELENYQLNINSLQNLVNEVIDINKTSYITNDKKENKTNCITNDKEENETNYITNKEENKTNCITHDNEEKEEHKLFRFIVDNDTCNDDDSIKDNMYISSNKFISVENDYISDDIDKSDIKDRLRKNLINLAFNIDNKQECQFIIDFIHLIEKTDYIPYKIFQKIKDVFNNIK